MITISTEAKNKYVKDSVEKELVIGYCHKDYAEIANINMGLPVTNAIYDRGGMGTSVWYNPEIWNGVFIMSPARGINIEPVSTNAKSIFVSFYFRMHTLRVADLTDSPKWRFCYFDNAGELIYTYFPIDDLSIYGTMTEYPVQFVVDIPNGFTEFASIGLDNLYKPNVEVHNEGYGISRVKFMYSKVNAINSENMVLLKDIPDYDFTDYQMRYITKDNLEEESFDFTESLNSKDNLKYGLCEASVCEFTVVNYDGLRIGDLIYPQFSLNGVDNSIVPLGEFVVQSIQTSYEGRLEKKRITAYGKITNLGNNAFDWSTFYMYGANLYTSEGAYTGRGFEYARQIYSSVFSALDFFGINDIRKYNVEKVSEHAYSPSYDSWIQWSVQTNFYYKLYYQKITINNPDVNARYVVDYRNALDINYQPRTDDYIIATYMPHYTEKVDSLGRGFGKGDILVEETSTGALKHRYMVDRGDGFMISKSCTSLIIRVPVLCRLENGSGTVYSEASLIDATNADAIRIYKITDPIKLTNGAERLMYYNYMSREIFPIDSSLTGRDVVRSLLEVCGCFFGLTRADGIPEFKYPQKSGLYPSNTLYPSDTLFPRSGTDAYLEMGRYQTLKAESYSVMSYGKIQIVKKEESNDTESCVWEHEGSSAKNTYIIDDNVYYCAEDMIYDYDLMIDVSRVLSNMFLEITNNNYTPFKATLVGLPWIECGDRLDFRTYNGNFETFVYRRKLKGIDSIKDTYEAKGDKMNEAVNTYLYTQEE